MGRAVIAARSAGLLLTGGGHAMAAGFSLHAAAVPEFQAFLNERLAHAATLPRAADLPVDATLTVPGATVELAGHLRHLEPYGHANEEPVFAIPRARVVRTDRIGKDGNTLRAQVEGEGGGVPPEGHAVPRRRRPPRRSPVRTGRPPAPPRRPAARRGMERQRHPHLLRDGRSPHILITGALTEMPRQATPRVLARPVRLEAQDTALSRL